MTSNGRFKTQNLCLITLFLDKTPLMQSFGHNRIILEEPGLLEVFRLVEFALKQVV